MLILCGYVYRKPSSKVNLFRAAVCQPRRRELKPGTSTLLVWWFVMSLSWKYVCGHSPVHLTYYALITFENDANEKWSNRPTVTCVDPSLRRSWISPASRWHTSHRPTSASRDGAPTLLKRYKYRKTHYIRADKLVTIHFDSENREFDYTNCVCGVWP